MDARGNIPWIAAEDADEAAERGAGWHWASGSAEPEPVARAFVWNFYLLHAVNDAGILLAVQRRASRIWLDGTLLYESHHPMAMRTAHELALGPLEAGSHRLAVEVHSALPLPIDVKAAAVAALLSGRRTDGGMLYLAPLARDWMTAQALPEPWHERGAVLPGFVPAVAPVTDVDWRPSPARPAHLMRRSFVVHSPARSATLEITALGAYEAELNGQRVGDALLTPEPSDVRYRLLYQTYDVRSQLLVGENVLGVIVGDGHYASELHGRGRYPFGESPRRLLARLEIVYEGGAVEHITTDADWRRTKAPIVRSEIYHGETYDARLEASGWSAPGFDDAGWEPVALAPAPPCALHLQESPPIRAMASLAPRTITALANGEHVVDFGQNFAGWCRIRVRGNAGDRLTLRFAEVLGEDGQVDMRNLRTARCTDHYILRGDPEGETWQPRFTYHGFRYVQVAGWPGVPTADSFTGVVVHNDLPVTGSLASSNPIVDGLWRNTLWSQRSNFVGVPTDCPQRDERMGWTGDAQIFWPTAAFNMDVRGFTRRFLADMRASQQPAGAYMDTNPPGFPTAGGPGWSDAGVVLPYAVWRHYGGTAHIDEHWASMERWMAWIADANEDGIWRHRRLFDYGDWLSLDAKSLLDETTPKLLTATACWARMLGMMAELAEATDRQQAASHYRRWHDRVRQAFAAEFIRPDGEIGVDSHTGYILPLAFGIVPQDLRQAAADKLAANIRRRGTLLTTGFLGTPFSLDTLADHGHAELAVELLLRTEFPSWGYMIAKGATTIWERWNSDVGDVAMNSFNHYALGAVTGFLYRRVAGIAALTPGFRVIDVRPLLDPRLGSGQAALMTDHGEIATAWQVDGSGNASFTLTVPPGCQARVTLPGEPALMVEAGQHRFAFGHALST